MSTHGSQEFLDLLRSNCVETVVDARRFPQSRFEHFKKDNLLKILKQEGFNYMYLGRELGGFRKGGYVSYTQKEPYKAGVSYLEKIAREGVAAIICAERFPWKCRPRFIAGSLEEEGSRVEHIMDKDRVWRPKRNNFDNLNQVNNIR